MTDGTPEAAAALRAAISASPPLSGPGLDRADPLRRAPEARAAAAARGAAKLLSVSDGRAPIAADALAWTPLTEPRSEDVFLGREDGADGALLFARGVVGDAAAPDGAAWTDFRTVAARLSPLDAATFAEARSLTHWHANHQFCARCGAKTAMDDGGWRRRCGACGAQHFPRTDPVVIMLALRRGDDGDEHTILGRQRSWPTGLYSLLAGYVEPGETVEQAVRREVLEEAGVRIGRVAYVASQPWPFPSTLMLGCVAEALGETLTPDLEELEDVRWMARAEVRRIFEGAPSAAAPSGALLARPDAIAHTLLRAWARGEIGL